MAASYRTERTEPLTNRNRYELLTSLVVPRPIGWISTWGADRIPNLAPFSYFSALCSTPMLVGASVGLRRGAPKDSLVNVRATGAFCVNVVTERQLAAMNRTSASHPPEIDEFTDAELPMGRGTTVDAPLVEDCPAVLECRLYKDIELGQGATVLLVGEVTGVRLSSELRTLPESWVVDPLSLRPVGRLWGNAYSLLGDIVELPRP